MLLGHFCGRIIFIYTYIRVYTNVSSIKIVTDPRFIFLQSCEFTITSVTKYYFSNKYEHNYIKKK